MSVKPKLTIEQVKQEFLKYGCELLSTIYTGVRQTLEYKCSCGNISTTSFSTFRKKGKRCRKCATKAGLDTIKNKNGGLHTFQTKKFRENYKKHSLEKYGTEIPSKSTKVKNKMKETFVKKYGVEYVSQVESVKEKKIKASRIRYGVDYRLQNENEMDKHIKTIQEKYNVPSVAYLSNVASNESQELFDAIYNKLTKSQKGKIYYARLNHEFVTTFEQKTYKYDFVSTKLKRCIEYNGYNFHPRSDQDENAVGWCAFHPNKTVKEAKEHEAHKYKALEERGYKILTIWDYEYKANKDDIVSKCIDFLLG